MGKSFENNVQEEIKAPFLSSVSNILDSKSILKFIRQCRMNLGHYEA